MPMLEAQRLAAMVADELDDLAGNHARSAVSAHDHRCNTLRLAAQLWQQLVVDPSHDFAA
jgi:hypothetical protein